jgi:hypothetical protein
MNQKQPEIIIKQTPNKVNEKKKLPLILFSLAFFF